MEFLPLLLGIVLLSLVYVLFLFFRSKIAYQKKVGELEKELLRYEQACNFFQNEAAQAKEKESLVNAEYQKILIKNTEIQTMLNEERKQLQEKMDLFKALSADALRQNNESFLQLAQATLEKFHAKAQGELEKKAGAIQDVVKPVKESLDKFESRVRDIEQARLTAYVSLKEQVQHLMESQKQLRQETSNLSRALRSPNIRGKWGEIQLKRVVELAGMQDHCDFYEQQTGYTEEEKIIRPDLLVRLPGKKNIIIDSKASLTAYFEALETENQDVRQNKLKEHAKQIRTHIMHLGKKNYWDQFSPTPEFVVLFLPGESFFSAALESDPSLIELGVDQKVILATPTTLIALLRAIAYGWKQEKMSQNAEKMCDLGKELYKRIVDMAEHFSKLGKSLNQAIQSYNKTMGTFESRVLVSARRFKDLESIGAEDSLEVLEPIDQVPRELKSEN